MPRPKVKDSERQRSARACLPCKASKIRCDALSPCGHCSKRDRPSACVYAASSRKRHKTSSRPASSSDNTSPSFAASSERGNYAALVDTAAVPPTTSTGATVTENTTPIPEPGQPLASLTKSRMLLSSKGEKLYVGENASISFLQFLRQILKKHMGPSAFTENQFKDRMLEVEMARYESPNTYDQSRGEKYVLVQLYREASCGILDLFTVEETHGLLDRHDTLSPSTYSEQEDKNARAEQVMLNMMLAIGSQCRGQKPFDPHNAARSFTFAQKFAFEGFLCDPSVDMVRVFLLMAFYMLAACHRNAAFMYLGIASKAACALGLHRRERHKALSSQESSVRWRTWKSLLILDTIVSSILGRPGGLPSRRPEGDPAYGFEGDKEITSSDRPAWLASNAVFTICSHIIELEQQLLSGTNIDSHKAENFLSMLRKWNETLPSDLRHFAGLKDTMLAPAERELFGGATHVACMYYFSIILATRPAFISHLVAKLREQRLCDHPTSVSRKDPPHACELAQACLDSAMYMARTGYMAVSSSILSNNLCIIKAWMFAAGLLLGFFMFVQAEPVSDVDNAFHNAISVLQWLAHASPQARHYLDILVTFSHAIQTRREQLSRERRQKSNRYVSQIFTAEFSDGISTLPAPAGSISDPDPGNLDPALNNPSNSIGLDFEFDSTTYDDITAFTQSEDWNDMPPISDQLYVDWESILPAMND